MAINPTQNLALSRPTFDETTWHDEINDNFYKLDAYVASLVVAGLVGTWENSTAYAVNDYAFDTSNNTTYQCLVAHTSAASPSTFADDRTAHPTYWQVAPLVTLTAAQVLTNKTLTAPVMSTPWISDSAGGQYYKFVVSNLTADRNVTLPLLTADDTFVFASHTQTLSNKTLNNPILSGTTTLNVFNDTTGLDIINTSGGAGNTQLKLFHNSPTPANGDFPTLIEMQANSSTGVVRTVGRIQTRYDDTTNGSEDSTMSLQVIKAGTVTPHLYLGANAASTAANDNVGFPLGQLSMPAAQNASTGANVWDDYEEGSFTVTLVATGASFVYASRTGSYIKNGQNLNVNWTLTLAAAGSVFAAANMGFDVPFTSHASGANMVLAVRWFGSTNNYVYVVYDLGPSAVTGLFGGIGAAGTAVTIAGAQSNLLCAHNVSLSGSGHYRAAA